MWDSLVRRCAGCAQPVPYMYTYMWTSACRVGSTARGATATALPLLLGGAETPCVRGVTTSAYNPTPSLACLPWRCWPRPTHAVLGERDVQRCTRIHAVHCRGALHFCRTQVCPPVCPLPRCPLPRCPLPCCPLPRCQLVAPGWLRALLLAMVRCCTRARWCAGATCCCSTAGRHGPRVSHHAGPSQRVARPTQPPYFFVV